MKLERVSSGEYRIIHNGKRSGFLSRYTRGKDTHDRVWRFTIYVYGGTYVGYSDLFSEARIEIGKTLVHYPRINGGMDADKPTG